MFKWPVYLRVEPAVLSMDIYGWIGLKVYSILYSTAMNFDKTSKTSGDEYSQSLGPPLVGMGWSAGVCIGGASFGAREREGREGEGVHHLWVKWGGTLV